MNRQTLNLLAGSIVLAIAATAYASIRDMKDPQERNGAVQTVLSPGLSESAATSGAEVEADAG
ncbi:MAG: hypothetical protein R3C58_06685 [Parvularculaceae bacterium]